MKKEYKKPEVEIYELEVEDIITTSGKVENKKFNPFGVDIDNVDDTWKFQ